MLKTFMTTWIYDHGLCGHIEWCPRCSLNQYGLHDHMEWCSAPSMTIWSDVRDFRDHMEWCLVSSMTTWIDTQSLLLPYGVMLSDSLATWSDTHGPYGHKDWCSASPILSQVILRRPHCTEDWTLPDNKNLATLIFTFLLWERKEVLHTYQQSKHL